MRIIVFSDLHVHAFKDFSRTLKNGRNSRLENTLKVLRRIRKYAVKHGIRLVLFGGDLFHKKSLVPVATYQAVYEELERFTSAAIDFVGVVGNHDQATLDGKTHALKALSSRLRHFYDEPELFHTGSGAPPVWCVPYMEDARAFKEALTKGPKGSILLAHGGINGAVTGPVEYQPKEQLDVSDVPDWYAFRLFGHYHRRQKLGERLWYIGSPLQMMRGERQERDKGFIALDTDTWRFRSVALGLPEFVTVTFDENTTTREVRSKVQGNYVDAEFYPDQLTEQRVMELAEGAEMVNLIPLRTPEKVSEKRLDVDLAMSHNDALERYVREYADADDVDDILKEAREFLGKAV